MNRTSRFIIFFIVSLALAACSDRGQQVEWYETTAKSQWINNEDYVLSDFVPTENEPAEILLQSVQQEINGFGFCFNELGWYALNMLTPEEQEQIMSEFFKPGKGFNLNICRMPIGANDYARSWYSLNDTEGDFAMEHFNIERDRNYLIPYIKLAMKYNPELYIWGSPWCPPAWMKSNNHYACRPDDVNDLQEEGRGQENVTQFIMEPKYLEAYADYFSKYIDAYQREGINVYAVHVQNEMNSCQNFPSCIWTSKDLATFIGQYLGPELENEFPEVELWYGTVERPFIEKVDTILQDEDAQAYVDGVGFQWAGKGAIPEVNEKYPAMNLMQTESECGNGSNDWAAAEYTWSLIKHYLNNGANSYMYWNPILDESGKSQWGWKQNSLISVDTITKKTQYNPEYFLFKHLTSKIKPGAVKVEVNNDDDMLAFKNPDGQVVLLTVNQDEKPKDVKVKMEDKLLEVQLKAKSFNTFVL
jgi:glucosylceramidase